MKWMDRLHPKPLPMPACFYRENEIYPERIRASFTNGRVRTYRIETKLPDPNLVTDRERRRMYRENGGYMYRDGRKLVNLFQKVTSWFMTVEDDREAAELKAIIREREDEIILLREQIQRLQEGQGMNP